MYLQSILVGRQQAATDTPAEANNVTESNSSSYWKLFYTLSVVLVPLYAQACAELRNVGLTCTYFCKMQCRCSNRSEPTETFCDSGENVSDSDSEMTMGSKLITVSPTRFHVVQLLFHYFLMIEQ